MNIKVCRRDEWVTGEVKMKALKCCFFSPFVSPWKESPLSKRTACCKSKRFPFVFKIKVCMALQATTRRREIEDYVRDTHSIW